MRFTLYFLLLGSCLINTLSASAEEMPESDELIEKLFANPVFYDAKLSPDGRFLATIANIYGKRNLAVFNLESLEFNRVYPPSGYDISAFYWIDNDEIVYYVSRWEMFNYGLYSYSVRTTKGKRLLSPYEQGGLFRRMVDPLIHMENTFVYERVEDGSSDLVMMDTEGRISRTLLARNTGEIFRYFVDRSGTPLFALESKDRIISLLQWNTNSEKWVPSRTFGGSVIPLGMLTGSHFLVASVKNEKGFAGINILDLRSGEFPQEGRFVPGYDMYASRSTSLFIDNTTGYLAGLQFHMEKPVNFWLDGSMVNVETLLEARFPGHKLDFLGIDPYNKFVFYMISSDINPPVLYRLDIEGLEISVLYKQMPHAEDLEFRPMEPVSFEGDDGETVIHGYLTKPEGKGPYPTVVLVHGGPHVRDTWGFDPQVQFLALNGYAVLQVNYSGSSGYGHSFDELSLSEVARISVGDVVAGAKWLIGEGIADPKRMGIMGGSFGAYISLAAVAREPDLFNAAIGFAGVYDLDALYKQDQREGHNWVDDFFDDYDEEVYNRLSPVNQADKISADVLIIHGKEDQRVPAYQAKHMIRALKKADNDVESLFIGWGVHGLPDEKDRKKYYRTIISFLDEYLKPGSGSGN